jgi:hypothetical protein
VIKSRAIEVLFRCLISFINRLGSYTPTLRQRRHYRTRVSYHSWSVSSSLYSSGVLHIQILQVGLSLPSVVSCLEVVLGTVLVDVGLTVVVLLVDLVLHGIACSSEASRGTHIAVFGDPVR